MKILETLNESKVSDKKQLQRIGTGTLQLIERGLQPKELRKMFPDMDENAIEYFDKLRKEAVEAIQTMKKVKV